MTADNLLAIARDLQRSCFAYAKSGCSRKSERNKGKKDGNSSTSE
ncbi:MAG: hypothetical protein P2A85_24530 [Microcoleus anatoxicus]